MTKQTPKISFALAVLASLLFLAVLAFAANSYNIPKGGGSGTIDEQGVCNIVTNNRADYDIFVPTKTAAEWEAFRNHAPTNVIVSGCMLVNNQHTFANCSSAGGTLVDDGAGNKMCKLSASSCPSGWNQYNSWSTTQAQSSSYTNEVVSGSCTLTCIDMATQQTCSTSGATCSTSGHAWSNQNVESNTCVGTENQRQIWSTWITDNGICRNHIPPVRITACGPEACTGATTAVVTSTRTEIGCY